MKRTGFSGGAAAWLLAAGMTVPAHADVRTITITARGPALNGQSFGTVGPYEQITGIATGEIDPADPRNALITDIDLAPRNTRGMVEYRTTFTIRKPVDMSHAPGVLFYNIVNRGNHGGPTPGTSAAIPATGSSTSSGTRCSGAAGRATCRSRRLAPARKGSTCPWRRTRRVAGHGPGRERFINVAGRVNTQSLLGGAGRMPATLDTTKAVADFRAPRDAGGVKGGVSDDCQHRLGVRRLPDRAVSGHARSDAPLPQERVRSGAAVRADVYTAKDPYVLGVGMAAMRDVVSFFRYADEGLGRQRRIRSSATCRTSSRWATRSPGGSRRRS